MDCASVPAVALGGLLPAEALTLVENITIREGPGVGLLYAPRAAPKVVAQRSGSSNSAEQGSERKQSGPPPIARLRKVHVKGCGDMGILLAWPPVPEEEARAEAEQAEQQEHSRRSSDDGRGQQGGSKAGQAGQKGRDKDKGGRQAQRELRDALMAEAAQKEVKANTLLVDLGGLCVKGCGGPGLRVHQGMR